MGSACSENISKDKKDIKSDIKSDIKLDIKSDIKLKNELKNIKSKYILKKYVIIYKLRNYLKYLNIIKYYKKD